MTFSVHQNTILEADHFTTELFLKKMPSIHFPPIYPIQFIHLSNWSQINLIHAGLWTAKGSSSEIK